MSAITLDGRSLQSLLDETVLSACLRAGVDVPHACKSGVCHTCLLSCVAGSVPPRAQRGLPEHLKDRDYLLACQCVPQGPLALQRPQPQDMITACTLLAALPDSQGGLTIEFESSREWQLRRGQVLRWVREGQTDLEHEPRWTVLRDSQPGCSDYARWALSGPPPAPFGPAVEFGATVLVRGPLEPDARLEAPRTECPAPEPDAALWAGFDEGLMRRALEDFYAQVYADEQLAPYFEGVTQARAVDKQFSFMKQCLTGEKVYFGNRPRNAHHGMIISDALFDYRQDLMRRTLAHHGLDADQIARWQRIEAHFRGDIVKAAAWPRLVDGLPVHHEGFARETLSADTLCDHCQAPIAAGTTVLYHRRTGKVSCASCEG